MPKNVKALLRLCIKCKRIYGCYRYEAQRDCDDCRLSKECPLRYYQITSPDSYQVFEGMGISITGGICPACNSERNNPKKRR